MYNYEEIDKVFFADGHRLAETYLGKGITPEAVLAMAKSAYEAIDGLLDAFTERLASDRQPLDCKKGCHWCCSQAVFTNPWEAAYLGHHLKTMVSPERKKIIAKDTEAKFEKTRDMKMPALLLNKHFCPLLENQACSVYPARPMACRIYLSMSLKTCLKEYRHPEDKTSFPKIYDFPLHAGKMLNEGIAAWLREHNILIKEIPLEYALTAVLSNTDFISHWLSGKEVFPGRTFSSGEMKLLEGKVKNAF